MRAINKRLIIRWTGEAIVIIFSIVVGFWVENFREEKKENDEYLKILTSFRNAVYDEIGEFRAHYDTSKQGYIIKKLVIYSDIDSILNDETSSNDKDGLTLLVNELNSTSWSGISPETQLADNLSDHLYYLFRDSINYISSGYIGMKEYAFSTKIDVQSLDKKLFEFMSKIVDLSKPNEISVDKISLTYIKNSVRQEKMAFQRLLLAERSVAHSFKFMVINIDKALDRHDIDTDKLHKDYLKQEDFE